MDPAKSILAHIGVEKAAEITGKHISRIYRWTHPKERGGTGGVIPHDDALKLLEYARGADIPITEADFLRHPAAVEGAQ